MSDASHFTARRPSSFRSATPPSRVAIDVDADDRATVGTAAPRSPSATAAAAAEAAIKAVGGGDRNSLLRELIVENEALLQEVRQLRLQRRRAARWAAEILSSQETAARASIALAATEGRLQLLHDHCIAAVLQAATHAKQLFDVLEEKAALQSFVLLAQKQLTKVEEEEEEAEMMSSPATPKAVAASPPLKRPLDFVESGSGAASCRSSREEITTNTRATVKRLRSVESGGDGTPLHQQRLGRRDSSQLSPAVLTKLRRTIERQDR